jgi:hypothetical protein
MKAVFISHSSVDGQTAADIKSHLQNHGMGCWKAPEDIKAGMSWEEEIVEAITRCSVFILVWSKAAQRSEQTKRELALACSLEKVIIPFRIEDVSLEGTFAYYLTNKQWLSKDGDERYEGLTRMVEAVACKEKRYCSSMGKALIEEVLDLVLERYCDPERLAREIGALQEGCSGLHIETSLGEARENLLEISEYAPRVLEKVEPVFSLLIVVSHPVRRKMVLIFTSEELVVVEPAGPSYTSSSMDLLSVKVESCGTTTAVRLCLGATSYTLDHQAMGCTLKDIDDIPLIASYSVRVRSIEALKILAKKGLFATGLKELRRDPNTWDTIDLEFRISEVVESGFLIECSRLVDAKSLLLAYIHDLELHVKCIPKDDQEFGARILEVCQRMLLAIDNAHHV